MLKKSFAQKPIIFDEALLTSVIPYGEADCIVRMLTKEHGRLSGFFKRGLLIKKNHSPAQAPAFSRIGLVINSHAMPHIKSLDIDPVINHYSSTKEFAFRAYVAEVLEKLIPEEEHAPEIFSLALETFLALKSEGAVSSVLRSFELKLLMYCGYLPEFPNNSLMHYFDPVNQCFAEYFKEGFLPWSKAAVDIAQTMLIAKVGSMAYEGNELMMIARIFQTRLKLMGLLPLKSVEFLRQLSGRKQ